MAMLHRCLVAAIAIAALQLAANDARAYDDALYPNLKGQWNRTTAPRYDPNDRNYDRAPLTPEYRAIFIQNLKDQAAGGQGTDPTYTCLAPGMPRTMNAYEPLEFVVTPRTTYMLTDDIHDWR